MARLIKNAERTSKTCTAWPVEGSLGSGATMGAVGSGPGLVGSIGPGFSGFPVNPNG